MARIVRPGGGVAVFWNARADDRSPFLAAYTDLLASYIPEEHVDRREPGRVYTALDDLSATGLFEVDDRVEIAHTLEMSAERFVGYAFTASYTRLLVDEESQQRLRTDLAALIAAHFGDGQVIVPYDVDLYVGRRTDKGVRSMTEEGYIEVTGGRVWYRRFGDGDELPVLILHGGPGSASGYMQPLAERLSANRPAIVYDQLGCGRADHPDDDSLWTVDRSVEELDQVRARAGPRALPPARPFVGRLAGHRLHEPPSAGHRTARARQHVGQHPAVHGRGTQADRGHA